MNTQDHTVPHYSERGAVLVTALIMLVLMTLIGVTAMQSSTIEERMAGNLKELHRAFHAAEAGLRLGETYAEDNMPTSAFGACPADFEPLYADDDATEVIPEQCYALDEPILREFTSESGDSPEGITDGGNLAIKIPTYRYSVNAEGRVGTANTRLRSVYVVADF